MKLTTPLIVRLEPNGAKWKIAEPFSAYTDIPEKREWIHVPVDFETDFASIPKVFIPFLQWKDKFNKASVVHDYLYYTKQYPRHIADKIFLELQLALGIEKWKAYTFYIVVRLFGWTHWNKR